MKTKKKIIIGVLLTPVIVIFAYIVFLYFYMISETVTKGSAYGFTIGQNKEDALVLAKEFYNGQVVRFSHYDHHKRGRDKIFHKPLHDTNLKEISSFDDWRFEFESKINDHVKLIFKNGAVVEIKRLRSIELP